MASRVGPEFMRVAEHQKFEAFNLLVTAIWAGSAADVPTRAWRVFLAFRFIREANRGAAGRDGEAGIGPMNLAATVSWLDAALGRGDPGARQLAAMTTAVALGSVSRRGSSCDVMALARSAGVFMAGALSLLQRKALWLESRGEQWPPVGHFAAGRVAALTSAPVCPAPGGNPGTCPAEQRGTLVFDHSNGDGVSHATVQAVERNARRWGEGSMSDAPPRDPVSGGLWPSGKAGRFGRGAFRPGSGRRGSPRTGCFLPS